MLWFKKKKNNNKTNKTVDKQIDKPQQNNETLRVTKQFVQTEIDKNGIAPEYFDYEKIKLNKFLTNDKQYRKDLLINDCYCKQKNQINYNSGFYKNFKQDMNAINQINTKIDNNLELEKNNNLINAKMGYLYNQSHQNDDVDRYLQQQTINDEKNMDFRGLTDNDYNQIINNINKRAYELSKETQDILKQQQTKILNIINDDSINRDCYSKNNQLEKNPNQVSKYDILKEAFVTQKELRNIDESLLQQRYDISQLNKINEINDLNNLTNNKNELEVDEINSKINLIQKKQNEPNVLSNLNYNETMDNLVINNNHIYEKNNKTKTLLNNEINLDNLKPIKQEENLRISKNNRRNFLK